MKIGTFSEERPLAVFALCAGAGALAGGSRPREASGGGGGQRGFPPVGGFGAPAAPPFPL